MEMILEKEDLNDILKFLNSGQLVNLMNQNGLSYSAMGFVLQSILDAIDGLDKS